MTARRRQSQSSAGARSATCAALRSSSRSDEWPERSEMSTNEDLHTAVGQAKDLLDAVAPDAERTPPAAADAGDGPQADAAKAAATAKRARARRVKPKRATRKAASSKVRNS